MSRYRVLEDTSEDSYLRFLPQKKVFGVWWSLTLFGYSGRDYAESCIKKRLNKEAAKIKPVVILEEWD